MPKYKDLFGLKLLVYALMSFQEPCLIKAAVVRQDVFSMILSDKPI